VIGAFLLLPLETVEQDVRRELRNLGDRLPGAAVRFPESVAPRYQPMLFTRIRVYQHRVLENYDSGLTSPRSLSIDGVAKPGDTLRFQYQLGSHPRLRCEASARSA